MLNVGKVKAKVKYYTTVMPQDVTTIINIQSGDRELNVIIRYNVTTVGIIEVRKTVAKLSSIMDDYSQFHRVKKDHLFPELARAYYLSQLYNTPMSRNKIAQTWINRLGIDEIEVNDLVVCTYCEEKSLQDKQIEHKKKLVQQQLDQGIPLAQIDEDQFYYCVRCKLEDAEAGVYDSKELVEQLGDEFYFDHKKIRCLFFDQISDVYSSDDPESQELLRLIIDEKYYDRPAKEIADRLMFEIFELRDHMSDLELEVIRDEFDKILELLDEDPYEVDTGIPILFSCLTMNQIRAVEEYIDELLDIMVDPDNINKTRGHLYMVALRYGEKVRQRMDKIKALGVNHPDYKAIKSAVYDTS